MKTTSAAIAEVQKKLDAQVTATEGRRLLEEIGRKRARYVEQRATILEQLAKGETAAAAQEQVDTSLLPAAQGYLKALDAISAYAEAEAARAAAEHHVRVARDGLVLPLLAGMAVLLGALLAWRIGRSVTRPVAQARAVASRIAEGDLTTPVPTGSTDETGQLLSDLATMQDSLRRMVARIRSGSDSLGSATEQIATGNQDLSARTERAASNLQETAATLASLGDAMQACAGSADQARALADEALEIARHGGGVVRDVVGTMADIHKGSGRIGEITAVIDAIAFQTNMLALNAAVEAARAGEQGRGFGVVAGEVRSLAQRCADAAREIRGLIDASVASVEAGKRLVGQAGTTMQHIENSVQQVTSAIGEISSTAAGQATGVTQVHQAVAQLDEMTQQNAALVEEAAAAADSLKEQAASLGRLVAGFRLPANAH
ncbi:methyl-accepting chemotaxis protein [Ramlibacter sp. MMS24-I3-19]|uniref:methyl-accepting chemotaxis protein n=1 Tax=Ramlibacter sp. MMS24-I3-19 TaxID=3416606 RepID=UPI003D082536